ncbi:hypothetical protein AB7M25_002420 [Pseudomonas sp. AP3_22 TE3818]
MNVVANVWFRMCPYERHRRQAGSYKVVFATAICRSWLASDGGGTFTIASPASRLLQGRIRSSHL